MKLREPEQISYSSNMSTNILLRKFRSAKFISSFDRMSYRILDRSFRFKLICGSLQSSTLAGHTSELLIFYEGKRIKRVAFERIIERVEGAPSLGSEVVGRD
jgi:hypothetical protein